MKSIALTIFLLGAALYVSGYSRGSMNILTIAILLTVSVLASLLASVWYKGSFEKRLIKAAKIVFPLTAFIFLVGYFYETFRVLL